MVGVALMFCLPVDLESIWILFLDFVFVTDMHNLYLTRDRAMSDSHILQVVLPDRRTYTAGNDPLIPT